ncbi:MAG: DNA mismatch repair endonuclease MutL [Firmicutes bacterium]|nr:DNA mismatch repair endonuclease MutL [Bacillota bacterium]
MIRVLDLDTVNKIAAGEVVERPSSVVKELVENSLDAGADEISVEILKGGMSFIRVRDNGRGISKDQLPVALERHATSKIASVSDIEMISSLGFRGEALPSIAAVSNFQLASAKEGQTGYVLEVYGGKLCDVVPKAMSKGTIVEVEDLFYNVPARRKFIKSENTEAGRIKKYLEAAAISRPDVAFLFVKDGKKIIQTKKTDNQLLGISAVFGEKLASELLEIEGRTGTYSVKGYVGKPDIARGRRDMQIFILNGRIVECKTIQAALEKAFYDVIPRGRFPIAFLCLDIPSQDIDVNVHPAKLLVRLSSENQVFSLVHRAVKDVINERLLEPASFAEPYGTKQRQHHRVDSNDQKGFEWVTKRENQVGNVEEAVSFEPIKMGTRESVWDRFSTELTKDTKEDELFLVRDSREISRSYPKILGQANKTYIIAEWDDAIILYDQHSAHERILYEKYLDDKANLPQTELLFPLPLNLSPDEYAALDRIRPNIENLGFGISEFGPSTLAITHVPSDVPGSEAEEAVKELLLEKPGPLFREKAAAVLACRGSLKAGNALDENQMRLLILGLNSCKTPALCPHGRPTMLRLDWNELEKRFGRNR